MAQLVIACAIEVTAFNLTTAGGIDWALWNETPASLTPSEYKSGGGQTISAALFGGGSLDRSGTDLRTMSWTDGTNAPSSSNTAITYNAGFSSPGQGFEVTFPADTTVRIAKLPVAWFSCNARATAIISDTSTANQVDSTTFAGADSVSVNGTVTVTYAAASGGQTMKIRVETLTSLGGSRNVGIQAAAYSISASSTQAPRSSSLMMQLRNNN